MEPYYRSQASFARKNSAAAPETGSAIFRPAERKNRHKGTYPVHVVPEDVRVNHGDGLQRHEGDEANYPGDHEGDVLLQHSNRAQLNRRPGDYRRSPRLFVIAVRVDSIACAALPGEVAIRESITRGV